MKLIYVITCFAAILLLGCAAKKNNKTVTKTTPAVMPMQSESTYTMLEYSKGMCMGKCPVYNITIDSDGKMEYLGKMHVDKLGTYEKQLSKNEIATLFSALKEMNLFQYDDLYGGRVMDIPKQIITYREAGKEKKIICKLGYPDALAALMTKVDKMATSSDGWTLTKPAPENTTHNNLTSQTVHNEIIVFIGKDFDLEKWIVDYQQYDLAIKKSLSPNGFMWLLGFNSDKVDGKALVQLLRDDPDIKKADLNRKVVPRR